MVNFPLCHGRPDQHFSVKIAFITAKFHNQCLFEHINVVMVFDPLHKFRYIGPDIIPLNGVMKMSAKTAQNILFFNQGHMESLVGKALGSRHTRNTAADHQGFVNDGDPLVMERPQGGNPCHSHSDQILGLGRGLLWFMKMHPGVLVSDIGHFKQVFV